MSGRGRGNGNGRGGYNGNGNGNGNGRGGYNGNGNGNGRGGGLNNGNGNGNGRGGPAGSFRGQRGGGPPANGNGGGAWGNRGGGSAGGNPIPANGPPVANGHAPRGEQPAANGNGNGNGAAAERTGQGAIRGQRAERKRTIAPPEDQEPQNSRDDIVCTLPKGQTKKGSSGTPITLASNYFKLLKRTDWHLYQYRVDFKPDDLTTKLRKQLFRVHAERIGEHLFDGYCMYSSTHFPDPIVLFSQLEHNGSNVELTVRLVAEIAPVDPTMLHFFNIIIRKCLQGLKLEEIGRNFWDPADKKVVDSLKLEFWPGYITSMRQCENDVLLRVEIKHKLVRTESVLVTIENIMADYRNNQNEYERRVKDEILGSVVLTNYNNKTYKISDVDWTKSPKSTFDLKGTSTTFLDFYKSRYGITIRSPNQPLLCALPTKKDMHRGDAQIILLIPELCLTTGLTDRMRADQRLMRDVASHLHIEPEDRVKKVGRFMERVKSTQEITNVLKAWDMQFDRSLVRFQARLLNKEKIFFAPKVPGGQRAMQVPNDRSEWQLQSSEYRMTRCADLKLWVVIVTERDARMVADMVRTFQEVARQIGFNIPQPEIFPIRSPNPNAYTGEIRKAMEKFKDSLDMIFCLFANNGTETYGAVKRACCIDYGIPSQVMLSRHMMGSDPKARSKFKSVATKVVIQMNAKLGGIPWEVEIPGQLKNTMMVGFDVYHCSGGKGASVGALVASTNVSFGSYYSTTSIHHNRDELASNLCSSFRRALKAYRFKNEGNLPARIFLFRDGVGAGQLGFVYNIELPQIQDAIKAEYGDPSLVKFTMIIVTKRIDTRLFLAPDKAGGRFANPLPGTVVDDVITLPERHDFYLISQTTRNGTVSPTAYHVIFNQQEFPPGLLQMLAFKMCHLYFNCSTSVAVPAPCQYAHKLAYLAGVNLQGVVPEHLAHLLYYL